MIINFLSSTKISSKEELVGHLTHPSQQWDEYYPYHPEIWVKEKRGAAMISCQDRENFTAKPEESRIYGYDPCYTIPVKAVPPKLLGKYPAVWRTVSGAEYGPQYYAKEGDKYPQVWTYMGPDNSFLGHCNMRWLNDVVVDYCEGTYGCFHGAQALEEYKAVKNAFREAVRELSPLDEHCSQELFSDHGSGFPLADKLFKMLAPGEKNGAVGPDALGQRWLRKLQRKE